MKAYAVFALILLAAFAGTRAQSATATPPFALLQPCGYRHDFTRFAHDGHGATGKYFPSFKFH